jgi:acetyl-CoA carboxylase biotin carboxyl carrier protein
MADEKQPGGAAPGAAKVDVDTIRQLVALMNEHGLAELEIEQEDLVVRLRKAGSGQGAVASAPAVVAAAEARPAAAPRVAEERLPTINSPMVGTFYEASSPEADPFVQVGDRVTEDSIVCIIEAMKVFNEIRAEMSGTIEKVLVKNAQTVEFGAPMFVVRPD